MHGAEGRFVRVVIPSPLKEPLIYAVPPDWRNNLEIGMRVVVPLGSRKAAGIVVDFLSETSLKTVKEIIAVPDEKPILDSSLIRLSRWLTQYYLSPVGEVLATLLPPNLRARSRRIILPRSGEFQVAPGLKREILEEVRGKNGRTTVKTLARKFPRGAVYRALSQLAALGAIEMREPAHKEKKKIRDRSPAEPGTAARQQERVTLTAEQEGALHAMGERLTKGGFETFLLHGVTGSGKTEVYLRAMEEARRTNRRCLILVPEISLTPQLLDRLEARFPNRVGTLHSALSASERWHQWWEILEGRADVVVGARSAVFAPVPDLGLIVVDEEHDPSYKQEEGLRYHGRDLAVMRGKIAGCPVILGSATPAVESYENCRRGRYRLLELTQRVEQRQLPRVELVDLKEEGKRRDAAGDREDGGPGPRAPGLLSAPLIEALRENHGRGRQSLVFLNRRGFANFLQCRLCGLVLRCGQCSVSLTFHLKERALICHHCGSRRAAADLCPGCGNLSLAGVGIGTEQIERELSRIVPGARIARMDRDATARRGSQERLFRQWEKGEIDVLVGTQMITKGHDVSGVTLVGAVLADLSLNLPDFRAAERTFQLLSQVAGRAGRGKEPGKVIIQTYAPDHYALRPVLTHDYKDFFSSEIEFRRALNYPPFSRLVHLRLEGPDAHRVEAKATMLGEWLRAERQRHPEADLLEVLGPAPAPIAKRRGRYRWQILIKGKKVEAVLKLAARADEILPRRREIRLHIDVDPYNML